MSMVRFGPVSSGLGGSGTVRHVTVRLGIVR
jgi:hypothetical protein